MDTFTSDTSTNTYSSRSEQKEGFSRFPDIHPFPSQWIWMCIVLMTRERSEKSGKSDRPNLMHQNNQETEHINPHKAYVEEVADFRQGER